MEKKEPDPQSEDIEDLIGMVCPRPIAEIVQAVHGMAAGTSLRFLVDDPLALKAIPEELEEYGDLEIEIREHSDHWEIVVTRTLD